MKVFYKFDLNDPDDQHEYNRIKQYDDVYSAVFEITHNLKRKFEHKFEVLEYDNQFEILDMIFNEIYQEFESNNVNLDNL